MGEGKTRFARQGWGELPLGTFFDILSVHFHRHRPGKVFPSLPGETFLHRCGANRQPQLVGARLALRRAAGGNDLEAAVHLIGAVQNPEGETRSSVDIGDVEAGEQRPRIVLGDFRAFLSTATGYGTVGVKDGEPFVEVKSGVIPFEKIVYL